MEQQELHFHSEEHSEDYVKNGQKIPEKPTSIDDVMICQWCGQPIDMRNREHFSTCPVRRKLEFKWHLHRDCYDKWSTYCDMQVPGLMSERREYED